MRPVILSLVAAALAVASCGDADASCHCDRRPVRRVAAAVVRVSAAPVRVAAAPVRGLRDRVAARRNCRCH